MNDILTIIIPSDNSKIIIHTCKTSVSVWMQLKVIVDKAEKKQTVEPLIMTIIFI